MYTYIYAYIIYAAYMLAKGIETINKQTRQHTCNIIVGEVL